MAKIRFILYTLILSTISLNFVSAEEQPDWINNSEKRCSSDEICATGTGESSSLAKAEARNNILRYFEISINSRFSSSISSNEDVVKSFSKDDINELSEGILKGVRIKYNYKDSDGYYSYAVLNKNIATKEVSDDIEKLDSKMKVLVAENNVKYVKQLEKLYAKRGELNKRYLILTGNLKPEVVRYEDIFKIKKVKGENDLIFYVDNDSLSGDDMDTSDYLSNNLLDNGAIITLNKNEANRIIKVSVRRTDLYLKVDGFVKQKYSLKIESFDKFGKSKAALYEEFIESGRDNKQIKETIGVQIKDYILDNIGNLLQ